MKTCCWLVCWMLLTCVPFVSAQGAYLLQETLGPGEKAVQQNWRRVTVSEEPRQPIILRDIHEFLPEGSPPSQTRYREVLLPDTHASVHQKQSARKEISEQLAAAELRVIVEQGPAQNRINLTWLGDGYTEAEREKFFADVERMVNDLFQGQTFASYLPLFNVYAVFVPSQESGISDRQRRNTAFGLYRDPPGSKRAIMPGNSRAIENALGLAPRTDYPIIIANDDFYGGLGGRYAITTRSPRSGTVVLRHELGHNFGNVGEEYDGGYVYSGANHSRSQNVPWMHWVDGDFSVHSYELLSGDYIWKNLANSEYVRQFRMPAPTASGPYTFGVELSSVGWSTAGDVQVSLDGIPMSYFGDFTADRSFFKTERSDSVTAGTHSLRISEIINDGDNILAFANVYAFAPGYNFTEGQVGAYRSINSWGSAAGYRPTHDSCLMRDMRKTNFCNIDRENMWHRFLNRVSLIDDIAINGRDISLSAPALAGLTVRWYGTSQNTWVELPELRNHYHVELAESARDYRVEVEFSTEEVRRPTARYISRRSIEFAN